MKLILYNSIGYIVKQQFQLDLKNLSSIQHLDNVKFYQLEQILWIESTFLWWIACY